MVDYAGILGLRVSLSPRKGKVWASMSLLAIVAVLFCARASFMTPRVRAASQIQNSVEVVTVSGASFANAPAPLAPNSIVSAFGTQLATQTVLAAGDADPNTPGIQLPTTLGSTIVEVNNVRAGLFFVSANQINFLIPPQTTVGVAQIKVTSTLSNGDQVISLGTANIVSVSPGLFSANSNGAGPPAAVTGRLNASKTQFVLDPNPPVEADPLHPGRLLAAPVDVGTDEARPLVFELFGTGFRNSAPNTVHVIIGGVDAPILFAGAQPDFVGLDQINVPIPISLKGRGLVDLTVVINGVSSNTLQINLAGNNAAGLSVTSFSDNALAGQTVTISGTGFSTTATDNIVRFGSAQGRVVSATSTQLSVIVPLGAESGRLTVQTQSGETRSASAFRIRTSVSGIVQSTGAPGAAPVPLEGATVRLVGDTVSVRTNQQGTFVLSGIQPGVALIEVDGSTNSSSPPYPRVTLKLGVSADRDNQFTQPISLQQTIGAATSVGGASPSASGAVAKLILAKAALSQHPVAHLNAVIADRGVTLNVPIGTSIKFTDGKTSGQVKLTVLEKSRLPGINLPVGVYSTTIAQITPFGATFSPGAILSFPNPDPANLNAGAKVDVYRYDFQAGRFIKRGTATISADKSSAVCDDRIVDQSSYWFAAVPTGVTTVVGRVIDSLGFSVAGAKVTVNGRGGTTDQNGGFSIRDVATAGLTTLQADVVLAQQYGTPPRGTSSITPVVVGGVTNVGIVALSNTRQAALVLSPFNINLNSTTTTGRLDVTLTQPAPTGGLLVNLAIDDPKVATVTPTTVTIAAGQTTASSTVTRIGPGIAIIDATATLSGNALESFAVVTISRAAPVLTGVKPSSAPVGAKIVISGTGFSIKPDNNYFAFVRNGELLWLLDPSDNQFVADANGKPALQIEVPPVGDGPVTILAAVIDDADGLLSGISAPLNFTVLPFTLTTPTLTSVSPSQGKLRDQVTLSGTGFGSTVAENQVTFRQQGLETEARIVQASASQLLIEVPASLNLGTATIYARRVATDGSVSSASNALGFTITAIASAPPTPTLTSVLNSANQASGRDGDLITARGSGFGLNFVNQNGDLANSDPLISVLLFYQNNQFVTFATPTAASNGTQLMAVIPPGLAAGQTQITVATFDLDSGLFSNESAPVNFNITVGSLPHVDEDEPNDSPELATVVPFPCVVDGSADLFDLADFEITFNNGTSEPLVDLFFLNLKTTTNLSLILRFTATADLDLFILSGHPDSNGNFQVLDSSLGTTTQETLQRSLPAGDYLIAVGAFDGGSPYSLTITQGGSSAQSRLQGTQPVRPRQPIAVQRKKKF